MKKFFSMFVSFLCLAFAAQAQTTVTDLSQLSNDKVYTISSKRAFLLYNAAMPNALCSSNANGVSGTLDASNPAHQFRILKDGSKYYLYSEGAGMYVTKAGGYSAAPTDALAITDVNGEYRWNMAVGGNGLNTQVAGQHASGILVNNYTTPDEGNCFKVVEGNAQPKNYTVKVLGSDNANAGILYDGNVYKNNEVLGTTLFLMASSLKAATVDGEVGVVCIDGETVYASYFNNATKFYTMKNGKGGYVSLNEAYMKDGAMILSNSNTPKDKKALWTFEKNGEAYKIYNYSTGRTKVLGITGDEAAARTSMVDPASTSHSVEFDGTFDFTGEQPSYIKIKGTNKWMNNRENNRENYLALWNWSDVNGDKGTMMYLEEVDYADYPDEYYREVKEIKGIESYVPKNPNTLWYRTSAEAAGVSYPWMEYALPLGNGELGCMVFGGVFTEELQFNEKTLWSGPANQLNVGGGNRTFMNFGSVVIVNKDESIWNGVTDYVRYLDIEEGIAGVEFKNANGTKQVRKYFSSAPDQVIAGQYKSVGADKMNLLFNLEPESEIKPNKVEYSNGTISFTGAMESVNYAARLHVVADNNAVVTTTSKGIEVKDATEVTFYLKGATNFEGNMEILDNYFTTESPADVNNRVKGVIEAAAEKGFAAVKSAHVKDFTEITKRMTFSMNLKTPALDTKALVDNYYPNNPDANSTDNDHLFLEQLYFHYGRYLAISSNRKPIAAPNNLQGIWNDRASDSPWNSDVHTNINIQMNYWPTEITNLSDLHKPFVNFIIRGAQSAGWKAAGTAYNGGYGWSVLTESSLYNSMSNFASNYLVANVWYTSHLWTHWRYTQDKEFLEKAFPAMWSAAEFWFHRLIEDRGFDSTKDEDDIVKNYHTPFKFDPDGTYVAPDEYSAEQDWNDKEDGTAHAQQMIYYLFQNIKEAIGILGLEKTGLDNNDITKLDEYIAKTDQGLHTEKYTGVWGSPKYGVKTNDLLLREWKYSPFDCTQQPEHRHLSHLMALYPLDQITPESPYFEPAVNSLRLRGDGATGWSMGWKVNLWARAQDGNHAHLIMKNALKHSTDYGTNAGAGGVYYNLFDSHAPFQIDGNFGVCSGVAEMLMQSAHGYISVLPALPKAWEKVGDVKGIKAMGNFIVDFRWSGGQCEWILIESKAGAPLKVRCKRGAVDIREAKITVNGAEAQNVVVDENGIATIPCMQGDIVGIEFVEGTLGIDGVNEVAGTGNVYDIAGRRVASMEANKVYIQDGVKRLAK